jgi:two-component system chemotaxis sensor kinase CheA
MTDKHKQAFMEEARELLVELEAALLELDQARDNLEVVGRAFRALHTIKGSGAMFGFDDIAAFTHNLETAFERLRSGQLTATAELINLTLAACDQIRAMLDEAAGLGSVDHGVSAKIVADLRELTGAPESQRTEAKANVPVLPAAPLVSGNGPVCRWHIHFRPGPDVLLNGTNPLLLLGELRELGELRVTVDTAAIPPLREIDPERCYLAWDVVLATTVRPEAIRDVFIFVEQDCELTIQPDRRREDNDLAPPSSRDRSVARNAADSTASLRVSTEKLDRLVNLVGELVTVQARLSVVAGRRDDPDILAISEEIDRLSAHLRDTSMQIRMVPLRPTFERFRRLVHDLGSELHKDVELILEGADTELDKTVIDQLNDPLVHLIRNSMDHGIEPPEARRAAGKPSTATIHLSASHSGADVLIRVSDDGRGLDVEAVRARAVERGLIEAEAELSEAAILSLILAPGFSTAREVTDVSGRGVGMDIVRRSVEAMRGTIETSSQPGAGLTVTLRLPLTLAIIDGLLVRVGDAHFVLPLANSLECVELTCEDIRNSHGNHIANVRGEIIPYIRLSEYFEMHTEQPECEQIMVVETGYGHYGFVVDEVLGDHQTVIKNLGKLYRNAQGVTGATILGNGTVALILDPHRLVQIAIHAKPRAGAAARRSGGQTTTTHSGEHMNSEGSRT